jgi:type IV fimbrial biogenesis protein FimT
MTRKPALSGLRRLFGQRGLTTIEALCAVSVLGTAVSLAGPGMQSWRLKQALQAEAAALETDVHHARSAAVAMGRTVRLETQALGTGSCYVVHTGDSGDCRCTGNGQAHCAAEVQLLRVAEQPSGGLVRLITTNTSIAFDGQRGTVTPTATLKFLDTQGRALHQVINVMGRVRSCSPQAAALGMPRC